jgi:hydroxymethylpyrimidine pyrophosphatase-like HAD family hydrolase
MDASHLAVFDIDGTIAEHGVVPDSVLLGIRHLQELGYVTTVSTGRGYIRLRETLGENFDTVVSRNALIVLEHGTKIATHAGEVVFGAYFSEAEIDHIIDFTRANIDLFRLMWFNPLDLSKKVPVWCADEADLPGETAKRGHYAEVFTGTFGELRARLMSDKYSNITLKLRDHVKVNNFKLAFTRTPTNVIFQDGNMEFVRNNINKAIAIDYVLRTYDFGHERLLVAGNAINDVEMLNIDAQTRILVGEGDEPDLVLSYLATPESVIRVKDPAALGVYLQHLAKPLAEMRQSAIDNTL